jgi:hypothetical protein
MSRYISFTGYLGGTEIFLKKFSDKNPQAGKKAIPEKQGFKKTFILF